jgi:hypothetical protein
MYWLLLYVRKCGHDIWKKTQTAGLLDTQRPDTFHLVSGIINGLHSTYASAVAYDQSVKNDTEIKRLPANI